MLYYGIEQGFNGNCPAQIDIAQASSSASISSVCEKGALEGYGEHPDALKRQDMFMGGPWRLGSSVPEVDRTARISNASWAASGAWRDDAMLPRGHAMYQLTRKLALLRRSCPALSEGATVFHASTSAKCGFFAFSRFIASAEADQHSDEVIMLINPGAGRLPLEQLPLKGPVKRTEGQMFVNVLNTAQKAKVQFQSGQPHLMFPETTLEVGAMIFVAEGSHLPFNETLGIALCKERAQTGMPDNFV